ncbi:MAG: Methyltransferase FkbM [Nitrosospira multiformis]|jgi:FkbM family methyltransferase|nr:Methyltransferase FkbM [Nitrosospira multiformis]
MSRIRARLLQAIARPALKTNLLKHAAWRLILKLRKEFAQAVPPVELETTFDENIRIVTSLSDHIESQVFWQGFQEADEGVILLLKRLLPPDGSFIDVGANIGTFTLVAAHRAVRGQVHAFEPSAHHFARLAHNIELNDFKNVTLNRKGLYDQPGEAVLFLPSQMGEMNNSGAASLYTSGLEETRQVSEAVSLIRLDDYVREKSIGRVDIIKIDIEGAELKALEGARETIARFRPLVFMELDLDNLRRAECSSEEVLQFWKSLNYEVSIIPINGKTVPVISSKEFGPHQNLQCRPF